MSDGAAPAGRPSPWALEQAHQVVRHVGTVWVCDYGADSVARALDAARAEGQREMLTRVADEYRDARRNGIEPDKAVECALNEAGKAAALRAHGEEDARGK